MLKKIISSQGLEKALGQGATKTTVQSQRTAVFVIHGISPIQRYSIQDQFADAFYAYLKWRGGSWARAIQWPQNLADADITPSGIRIYDSTDGTRPDASATTFDIFEGYWSPLSKGKTSFASMLQWLINITFLATGSTANLPGGWNKLRWDVSYLGAVLLAFGVLSAAGIIGFGASWRHLTLVGGGTGVAAPSSISDFVSEALKLTPLIYCELGLFVLLGYCVAQAYAIWRVRRAEGQRTRELSADAAPHGEFHENVVRAQTWHRYTFWVFAIATLLIAGAALLLGWYEAANQGTNGWETIWLSLSVVGTFAAVQTARYFADFAVENVLGDVQVYTTHDTNAQYFAIRNQIIETVTTDLLGVTKACGPDKAPLYGQIHIMAHSLGSTIGLDVLMRLRMLVEEGSVHDTEFCRIRSFVTFGTSLEKTKFLFDVARPTISAAHDQWDADVFGRFFDDKPGPNAIYWHNLWYERDIVANKIESYVSDVAAGERDFVWRSGTPSRPICDNTKLRSNRPFWAFVHGDYLSDSSFWVVAGNIITQLRPQQPAVECSVTGNTLIS